MGRKKTPVTIDSPRLELDEAEMRALVSRAAEFAIRHVASLPRQPVHAVAGGKKLAASLREDLPERGAPVDRLLRTLFGKAFPTSLNTASPGYLAYIPGGGLFQSAVADFIGLAVNRYVGVWLAAPGLVQIEQNVIDWFNKMVGFPLGSGGLLTSGGSMANLIALVTARRTLLPPDFMRGVVYASDQAHHSVLKAALFAGVPEDNVRSIPSGHDQRIDIGALEARLSADRARGLVPFFVCANAGSTNTGAIDDLASVVRVARSAGAWAHADAAYGGFFVMTDRGRAALAGLELFDSITLDPHKGLFLPYGTGCLLVRDRATLRRAHAVRAAYMPPSQVDPEHTDFADMGPELSRDARGLRIWLPIKMHGAGAFRTALDEKLDLARAAATALSAFEGVELVAPPALSLFAFRYRPENLDDEATLEKVNRRLMSLVNDEQRVLLTGTRLGSRFVIRVCVLSFRTHADRIDDLVSGVERAIQVLRRGPVG
ncbi:MAG: aminotransferase class V-fold PLP-dependent enzyme [Polyangiaceae bacterium]